MECEVAKWNYHNAHQTTTTTIQQQQKDQQLKNSNPKNHNTIEFQFSIIPKAQNI